MNRRDVLKVRELEKGMMIRPSVNKWTQTRSGFVVEQRNLKRMCTDHDESYAFMTARIIARPELLYGKTFSIGIYMGYENSDYWLDGVKKHHLLLIGGQLTRMSGYEFRYIEAVDVEDN